MDYYALDEALEYIQLVEEGANMELTKKMRSTTKDYKAACKAATEAVKKHDFKAAKAKAKEALKAAEDLQDYANNMKGETASAFIGFFLGDLYTCCQAIVPMSIAIASAIGFTISSKMGADEIRAVFSRVNYAASISEWLVTFFQWFRDVKQARENFFNDKKENDTYNYYRIKAQNYAKELIKHTKNLDKMIERAEKKYEKKKKKKQLPCRLEGLQGF